MNINRKQEAEKCVGRGRMLEEDLAEWEEQRLGYHWERGGSIWFDTSGGLGLAVTIKTAGNFVCGLNS